ncbi:hypothetical protein KKE03_02600 [Patescibacteria group bacterium]|nr:hypothetical protein [Patescibacteria group bacterium]
MDGQIPQPENQVTIVKSSSSIFKRAVVVPVITLLLGFGLGFLAKSILPLNKPPTPTQTPKPSDESKLPISLSLLTNSIVYEWRGSVNGKLTAKDEHSFTLEDDKGNKITITDIMPDGNTFKTRFLEQGKSDVKETSLTIIPIGSTLRGDFFIFKNGSNLPVGSQFTYQAIK